MVHEDRLEEFLDAVKPIVEDIQLGSVLDDIPQGKRVDMGSMVSDTAVSNTEKLVEKARSEGAQVLVGGERYNHPSWPNGHYYKPTLSVLKVHFY